MKISDEIARIIVGIIFAVFLIGWMGWLSKSVLDQQDKQACIEVKYAVLENKIDNIVNGIERIEKRLEKEYK